MQTMLIYFHVHKSLKAPSFKQLLLNKKPHLFSVCAIKTLSCRPQLSTLPQKKEKHKDENLERSKQEPKAHNAFPPLFKMTFHAK